MTASVIVALCHLIGISAFRRLRCQCAHVLRIPDSPIPDARVSSIGYREIMISNASVPLYAEASKYRIPTPSDPGTRVPPIERLRSRVGKSRIAIPLCMSFTTPETPICRTPTPRDPPTRVLEVNGSDLIGKSWIAISCCTNSSPLKTPMPPNTDS
jgi:hypothetical protein